MTVAASYAPVREAGNGSKVDFDFSWKIYNASELIVNKITNATDALGSDLTLNVDYTVTINAVTEGGTVHYTVAPTVLQDSFIRRNIPLTQIIEVPSNNLFRENQLQQAFNRIVMMIQQLQEQLDRTAVAAPTETTELEFPTPAADQIIGWNPAGDALENKEVGDFSAVEKAATAEAEAGTDDDKYMTPAKVKSQIEKAGNLKGSALTGLASVPSGAGIIPAVNIEAVPWTDWSESAEVGGWESVSTKKVHYKKVGKLVFVSYDIQGVSNAVTAVFSVPYTISNTTVGFACGYTVDDGTVTTTGGLIQPVANDVLINLFKDMSAAGWTASGTKSVRGQFWYEATT